MASWVWSCYEWSCFSFCLPGLWSGQSFHMVFCHNLVSSFSGISVIVTLLGSIGYCDVDPSLVVLFAPETYIFLFSTFTEVTSPLWPLKSPLSIRTSSPSLTRSFLISSSSLRTCETGDTRNFDATCFGALCLYFRCFRGCLLAFQLDV